MRLIALSAACLLATPGMAQDRFMPTAPCTQVAGFDIPKEHRAMERYLYFAASALLQQTLSDTPETYAELRRQTGAVCVDMPYGSSLEEAIVALVQGAGNGTDATENEARALLEKFLQPGADLAWLTQSLRPSEAELAVIFRPALLPAVTAYTAQVFNGGTIAPNDGQTELLVVPASTSDLIDGKPVLNDFPGGYNELRPFLNRDIPVVRFKFVKPGETLGMAFDGLYKVGSRWVLIPKAWRAIAE